LAAGFSLGAVKVLDLKEKVESWRWPGCPQVLQGAGSSDLDAGRRASNSTLQLAQ
jgi:hypothetical protein